MSRLLTKLRLSAQHDPLTGTLSRSEIEARVDVAVDRQLRGGDRIVIALLNADLFKGINDEHGQAIGDRALQFLARLLAEETRVDDSVGRWGGDEFLVLMSGTELHGGRQLAERLRAGIAARSLVVLGVRVTASFGIAAATEVMLAHEIVARAERAVQVAKRLGRNQVQCGFADASA